MPTEGMGQNLMLRSEKAMNEVLDLLERFDQLKYADVKRIITVGVWNASAQTGLFELLQEGQRRGIPSPALIRNLEIELRRAVSYTFRIVDKVGGVSGVGSLQFERGNHGTPWEIFIPIPHFLVRNYQEGQFGRISGLPRTGKTNLACFIMQRWAEIPECVAISNIRPTVPDPRYIYVHDAKALFEAIAQLPDDKRWMFILDEGGLIYGKADASTRRAKDLDKLVRVLGKLHGSMIIVEQRVESVPTIIQEFALNIYYTQSPGVISVDLRGPKLSYQSWIYNFPKTDLPMDTYDIAYFNTESFNVAGLFEALSGQKDVKGAMRTFLAKQYKSSAHKFKKGVKRASASTAEEPQEEEPAPPEEEAPAE